MPVAGRQYTMITQQIDYRIPPLTIALPKDDLRERRDACTCIYLMRAWQNAADF